MKVVQDYTHLDKYMNLGFEEIEGWCSPYMREFCKLIDAHQLDRGVVGGIAEIGIHHGLFFILLNSLTLSGVESWAIDVFDKQEQNIDKSGKGAKRRFLKNLEKYDRYKGENVKIIECDSTTTRLDKIINAPVRIFSVDGGHTPEHTISDLKTAQSVLHPEGVVILDDMVNHHWLGVIEGCIEFLQTRPTLVPYAIGHNKLFMCNLSYFETYVSLFRRSNFVTKPHVKFMGWDIVAL